MSKELEEYFGIIKGKTLSASNLNTGNREIQEFETLLKQNDNSIYKIEGCDKLCTFVGDGKLYALLKYKDPIHSKVFSHVEGDAIVDFGKWLFETKKITTPRFYSAFGFEDYYFEVFERAKGSPIYEALSRNRIRELLGDEIEEYLRLKNLTEEQKLIVGKKVFDYNLASQEVLKNMPQQVFNKLFYDLYTLKSLGVQNLDTTPQNLLIKPHNNKIELVDIDYLSTMFAYKKYLSDMYRCEKSGADVLSRFYKEGYLYNPNTLTKKLLFNDELAEALILPFTCSRDYEEYLTQEQKNALFSNDVEILTKVVDAMSSANFKFNLDTGRAIRRLNGCLKDPAYVKQVTKSQAILQGKHQ